MASRQCQYCGVAVTVSDPTPRDSSCESCRHDYRACRQCRHYDPALNNACRETEAELVEDKERRNFCEFFDFNPAPFRAASRDTSREARARAKLEGLFKSGGGQVAPDRATDARTKLDALFRKPKSSEDAR